MRRLGVAALLLYVALDLANPLMPGALCFDAEQSIEAVGRARSAVAVPAVTAMPVSHAVVPPPPVRAWRPAKPAAPPPDAGAPRARAALRRPADPSPDDD
jgi:hypothetical protein